MIDRDRIRTALKWWPVITVITIALCYITQEIAGFFGVDLQQQQNVDIVRDTFVHAFDSLRNFGVAALNFALVVAILPFFEEVIFRFLLFRLPTRGFMKSPSIVFYSSFFFSSALFSAAHYLQQPFPDNAFFALFFFGLAQCWLYLRTERLYCPVLNHSLFNITNLVLMFLIPQ